MYYMKQPHSNWVKVKQIPNLFLKQFKQSIRTAFLLMENMQKLRFERCDKHMKPDPFAVTSGFKDSPFASSLLNI